MRGVAVPDKSGRKVYKSASISWGVIKSLMKEVDWSASLFIVLLLSFMARDVI